MHINPRLPLHNLKTGLTFYSAAWNIHALRIARNDVLKEQLHHDGYVEYVQALSNLPTSKMRPVVLSDDVVQTNFASMFYDKRKDKSPYTGRIVVCFERSKLQEHAGGNFVVLRVLKILDPITILDPGYDMHIPLPRVGSLLLKSVLNRKPVCAYDLDGRCVKRAGLKRLPSIPDIEPDL
ncbi:hypothetical protein C0989_007301 [Termitomyces sp. Mn162]|nr:hypothetical protein C0989_007301 [Termitomyces sp. Mn162]